MNELTTVNNLDVMSLGEVLQRSGYFQDVKEASQAVVKILAGQELGIGPIAAMTGIYIVKGRVTLSANLMAAQIKRSGRYNYRVREMTEDTCSIEYFEGDESIGVSTFTMKEAIAAKLDQDWDRDSKSWKPKATWRNFPRNMLFARAMSNGAKWYCPDVFAGPVYTPDELVPNAGASYVDAATGEIIDQLPIEEPQKSSVKAPEKAADAPKADGAIAAAPKRIEALRTLWAKEKRLAKALGIDVPTPAADSAIDLSDPKEATVDRVNALGKAAKGRVDDMTERLAALQAQEQPV